MGGVQFATEPVPILLNYISVSKIKTENRIVKLGKILEFYGLFKIYFLITNVIRRSLQGLPCVQATVYNCASLERHTVLCKVTDVPSRTILMFCMHGDDKDCET